MLDLSIDLGLNNLFEEWGVLVDDCLVIDDFKIGRLVGFDFWVVLVIMYGEYFII